MIKLKNILLEKTSLREAPRGVQTKTGDAVIPLIYGLTYDVKLLQNGRDITEYINKKRGPDTQGRTDILINFPDTVIPITMELDKFEVKFTPIDGDTLERKKQVQLKKIYNDQGFKMARNESFPILSPATIPSFKIGYDRYDERYLVYKGNASSVYSGDEYPYDKRFDDFEIYNGEQFNVYVRFENDNANIVSEQEGQNKKTIQKLSKEGWKKSAVSLSDIINNEELQYVEKAGINGRGFAGAFIGSSKDNIQYFVYIPGLQGYRGIYSTAYKEEFFDQFEKDAQGVYEGGNYFEFNHKTRDYN
jgi:hypothetical protein